MALEIQPARAHYKSGMRLCPYHGGSDSVTQGGCQGEWLYPLCGRYRQQSRMGSSTRHPLSSIASICDSILGRQVACPLEPGRAIGGKTSASTCSLSARRSMMFTRRQYHMHDHLAHVRHDIGFLFVPFLPLCCFTMAAAENRVCTDSSH